MRHTFIIAALAASLASLAASPAAHAQTTQGCQVVTNEGSSAAEDEIQYLRNNVRKPQSVKNLTCLTALTSISSMTADGLVLSIEDKILSAIISQICSALNNYWQQVLNQLKCGISVSGIGLGFPNLGGGTLCQFKIGSGQGTAIHLNAGIGPNGGGYYINGVANGIQQYGR